MRGAIREPAGVDATRGGNMDGLVQVTLHLHVKSGTLGRLHVLGAVPTEHYDAYAWQRLAAAPTYHHTRANHLPRQEDLLSLWEGGC